MRSEKIFIIALVVLIVVLAYLASIPDATKSHDKATYRPQFAINETYIAEMEAKRKLEMQIWLAPNLTENYTITIPFDANITVWKGDKMVCYIPRGA